MQELQTSKNDPVFGPYRVQDLVSFSFFWDF